MSRTFFDALTKFMENLIYMSGMSQRADRKDWQGTAEDDRARVRKSFLLVRAAWRLRSDELAVLEDMLERCLRHYERGEFNPADYLVRDIDEFQSNARDRVFRPQHPDPERALVKPRDSSNDPKA